MLKLNTHTPLILLITILGFSSLLTACTGRNLRSADAILPGSRLVLNQDVVISAGEFATYFQYGKQIKVQKIDQYYPNCQLLLRQKAQQDVVVKADTFNITKVNYLEMVATKRVIVASSRLAGISISGNGSPGQEPYRTILYLRSDRQPNVLQLECSEWQNPHEAEVLGLTKIKQAVGSYMDVTRP